MKKLVWTTVQRKVKELVPLDYNPRTLNDTGRQKLAASLEKFNLVEIPVINTNNQLIAGNQRVELLMDLGRGEETIDVRMPNRALTQKELKEYNITSNTHVGIWDVEKLTAVFQEEIDLVGMGIDMAGLADTKGSPLDQNFDGNNKEINVDDFEDKCTLRLTFPLSQYEEVNSRLLEIADTPESAVLKLLKINE